MAATSLYLRFGVLRDAKLQRYAEISAYAFAGAFLLIAGVMYTRHSTQEAYYHEINEDPHYQTMSSEQLVSNGLWRRADGNIVSLGSAK